MNEILMNISMDAPEPPFLSVFRLPICAQYAGGTCHLCFHEYKVVILIWLVHPHCGNNTWYIVAKVKFFKSQGIQIVSGLNCKERIFGQTEIR